MKMLDYFKQFLEESVNLNQTRLNDLDSRVDRITEALKSAPALDGRVLDTVPQGSWAHQTIIRPADGLEFDADLLLQVAEDLEWNDSPRSYANAVWTALSNHSTYGMMGTKKDRCVRVTYANDCHVDVVPYVILSSGREVIINRTTNEFEDTNPIGFTDWIQEKDTLTNGNLRKVIRLLKYLRDHRSAVRIKSILLTTMVGTVADQWRTFDPNYYKDVPTTLLHLVEDLDAWLQARVTRPSISDPSCPQTTFDHRWTDENYRVFRDRIHTLAPKIRDAYDAGTPAHSITAWQEVFGPAFPSILSSAKAAATTTALTKASWSPPATRAPGEVFIEEKFPVSATHTVRISAKIATPRNRAERRSLRARAGRVRKQCILEFSVDYTDVAEPFHVYWKVRNHGDEARTRGQLRGQIVPGARQRRESTAYTGHHYVECYIVKNGVCVARTRENVIIR